MFNARNIWIGKRGLVVILAVAAILYLLTFLYVKNFEPTTFDKTYGYPIHAGGDSLNYLLLAENINENGAFSLSEEPPFEAEMFRSPGYPLFVSLLLEIFGSPISVSITQIILVLGLGVILYKISLTFLPRRLALLGTFISIAGPSILFYSQVILSDVFYLFILTLAVYLLFFQEKPTLYKLLAAGIIFGLSVLIRPAGSYLLILLLPFLVVTLRQALSWRHVIVGIIIFILSFLSVTLPWQWRNHVLNDSWRVSSIGPYTLLFYHVRDFYVAEGEDLATVEKRFTHELGVEEKETLYEGMYADQIMNVVTTEVSRHPLRYAYFHLKGSAKFIVGSEIEYTLNDLPNLKQKIGEMRWFFNLENLFWIIMFLGAIATPFLFRKDRKLLVGSFLLLVLIIYPALIFGPISHPRYRLSAEPFLIILGITGVYLLSQKVVGRYGSVSLSSENKTSV